MHDLAVLNARILSAGAARVGSVLIDGDRVVAVGRESAPARRVIDAAGRAVTPGLIDLHLNGGMGLDFTSLQLDRLAEFEAWLVGAGVTGYLATLNTDEPARRLQALATLRRILAERPPSAPACLGFMLEGPHYSPAQVGAHDPSLFGPPDPAELERAICAAGGWLRVWSLAPEQPGGLEAVAWLAARGIVPAIGHSSADFTTVLAAADAGARLVTHLYCCLDSFSGAGPAKRLGGNEGALFRDDLTVEVIADGVHVPPVVAAWIAKVAGWRRCGVVTDAMAAAGLGDGVYEFLGGEVHVIEGRAYRGDRTHFAGSTADLASCLANFEQATGLSAAEVAATATMVPAKLLGRFPELGCLAPGSRADLVIWNPGWRVAEVVVGGRPVER